MTNLYRETTYALQAHNLTWDDVLYVGGDEFSIPLKNFVEIAQRTNYDSGYGRQEIASDLHIYTHHGILKRFEYDGSEGWEWIPLDNTLWVNHQIDSVFSKEGWQTLDQIYKEKVNG